MHDAGAGRARQRFSGPTMPWRVLGAQVDAVGGSHGDRVGGSVTHSSLVDVKAGQRTVHSHYRLRHMNVPWISTPSLTCDESATSATTPLSQHVTIPTIHGKVVESTVLRPTTHPSNFQQVWKMLRASSGCELRRGVTLTLGMCTKCAHSMPLYRDRQSFAVLWQRTTSSAGG